MRRLAALGMAVAGVLLLTSCSYISELFGPSDDEVMRDKMAHIIEAVNDQDAGALRALFTDYALAEYSDEVDEGVAHLLSLFPHGDVIWRDAAQPAGSGSGEIEPGGRSWLGGLSGVVSSAGREYTLEFSIFTENTIDPDNVGIFRIDVDPLTEGEVSGAELASCGLVDTDARAGAAPGVFIGDSGGLSHDRAAAIVAALNAKDAGALKNMFTEYARAEFSAQIDEGLEYLLSVFSKGEVTWGEAPGGSAVCEHTEGDEKTVLLPTYYTVRSAGVDYRLFFADFTENTIDPENVGIYAIGAVPAAECGRCEPEAELNTWASDFHPETAARPGVFVPASHEADRQMEHIAAALGSHDAAALKAMFSADVREGTPSLDDGVDYLLSLFPNEVTAWVPDPAEINPIHGYSYVDAGELTQWVVGNYRLSVDGQDYWLFLSGVTVNEANPGEVGLESLGVTPWIDDRTSEMPGAAGEFYSWAHAARYPGVYVPGERGASGDD